MKRLFYLWCFWLSSLAMSAIDTGPFRMQAPPTRTLKVSKTFTANGEHRLGSLPASIQEAGVDATVSLFSDTSMVRVFLDDAQGGSHLLLECLPRYAEKQVIAYRRQGEETADLGGISPKRLRVVVKAARVQLGNLYLSTFRAQTRSASALSVEERRRQQVREKVEAINRYNRSHEKYWRAKETGISLLPFAERQKMMSLSEEDDSQGWEFYGGGIFEFGSGGVLPSTDSPYVKNFDWRNRHGKNWITPVKKQTGQTCWAFATTALLESYLNCYFNEILDYDLSEQDLVTYVTGDFGFNRGGRVDTALRYVRKSGIVNEDCYPYFGKPSEGKYQKCASPTEKITIDNIMYQINLTENEIKSRLLHSPISISMYWREHILSSRGEDSIRGVGHAVLLVGYHNISPGDTILINGFYNKPEYLIARTYDADRLGTIWTIKNSFGESWGNNGFADVTFRNLSSNVEVYGVTSRPIEQHLDEHLPYVTDEDGDGFYTWGIGPRPASLPAWIPTLQDGDDSDPEVGGMNEYGHCEPSNPVTRDTIYVNTDTTWEGKVYLHNHVVVRNYVTLSLRGYIRQNPSAMIVVEDGATLDLYKATFPTPCISTRGGGTILAAEETVITLSEGESGMMNLGTPF